MTTPASPPLTPLSPTSIEKTSRGFRPEIQALRAVAVLAVVVNHIWPGRLTGGYIGVDVFFVISGFLITSHLLGEVRRTGTVRLGQFWARRARRLLPAGFVVLLAATIGTLLLIPASHWQVAMRQIIASALYVQNWALAADATDYFASGNAESPVTHYWSLSAEEQFYIVWPLLLLLAALVTRRVWRTRRTLVVVVLLGAVTVASFVFAVLWLRVSPNTAYFITPTRAWEFGAGGLLAALALPEPGRMWQRLTLSWGGWIAILASTALFTPDTGVPGVAALLPVLGTVAVIVAGSPAHPWAPTAVTGWAPVQFIGDISYSLYLWHWPLIVFAVVLGGPLGWRTALVVLAASIALAWLSKRYVEDAVRLRPWLAKARPRRTLIATLVAMAAVIALPAASWGNVQTRVEDARERLYSASADPADCFGALAVDDPSCDPGHRLADDDAVLVNATNQQNRVEWGSTCQQDRDVDAILTCEFGVPADEAETRVALTGDSHAGHWIGAIDRLAVERGWNVTMYVKSSCATNLDPMLTAGFYPEGAESCRAWAADVVQRIADDPDIDLVLTSSIARQFVQMDPDGQLLSRDVSAGFAEAWQRWLDAGKRVAVLADVPTLTVGDVPDCVARSIDVDDPCTTPAEVGLPGDPMVAAAEGIDDEDFVLADLTRYFCDDDTCHAVTGGVLMYGDANHISNTYSRTLAGPLGRELAAVG